MHLRLSLPLLIAALLTGGCPHDEPITSDADDDGGEAESGESGESGDSGEPLTEVPLEEFFAEAESAYCVWQTACSGFGTEGRCQDVMHIDQRLAIAWLAGVGSGDAVTLPYLQDAVAIGRIEYDEVAAATCLNYVRARSCDYPQFHVWTEEELAGQAACEQVLSGRMGKNGPCAEAIECAGEAICGFDPNCVDACCVGACRVLPEPVPVGEPCPVNPNASCVEGAGCVFDPNTGMPTVCAELAGEGEECINIGCAADLQCDFNDATPRCVALADEGAPCDWNGMCKRGLTCAYDPQYIAGECYKPADLGEACKVSPDQTCRRFDNYCDPGTNTCVTLPAAGEACLDYSCRGDLFCVYEQNLCSPVADEGEPCGYNEQIGDSVPCSGDQYCDYGENVPVCKAPGTDQCLAPEDV